MSTDSVRRKPGPEPLPPGQLRSVGVKVMLRKAEAEGLLAIADEAGVSTSEYLRRLVKADFGRYLRGEDS